MRLRAAAPGGREEGLDHGAKLALARDGGA